MEGERGTAMAFHVGAPARWLAVLACAIGGQRKERNAGKKERGWWRLTGGAGSAVREKGKTRAGAR